MANQKHMDLKQRVIIEKSLDDGKSFKAIGKELDKDCTTISKEVRLHKVFEKGAMADPSMIVLTAQAVLSRRYARTATKGRMCAAVSAGNVPPYVMTTERRPVQGCPNRHMSATGAPTGNHAR